MIVSSQKLLCWDSNPGLQLFGLASTLDYRTELLITFISNFLFLETAKLLPNMRIMLFLFLPISGNIASILVLTNKDIDLKPSFVNILICLVNWYFLNELC